MPRPLCFVLMPFGEKADAAGATIDFDAVYRDLIRPAVEAAGLDPLRADEEVTGGIIHKPMFERLIFCEYAVADLTTANANVFYELGLRHAVRPHSTALLFAEGSRLPFDVAPLRALPYALSPDGTPAQPARDRDALAARLAEARALMAEDPRGLTDSPIYQLVENYPDVDHTKTDVFRDRVRYSEEKKGLLAEARARGVGALREAESQLGDIRAEESGVVIDLFLSYRAVKAWDEMIALVGRMSRPLAETVMVQEQLALALNRAGRGDEAERVLLRLLDKRGPSSETLGILGRVYKDRWDEVLKEGKRAQAAGWLRKAVDAYLRGFEADWRDSYPGVNAVTLMELSEPPDPRGRDLIPIVAYAVERRMAAGKPDYWGHATRLELAVLSEDREKASHALSDALAYVREVWEAETTANNLRLIREARERRGRDAGWVRELETALLEAAAG